MEESKEINSSSETIPTAFKKPILIGKVGRLPRKTTAISSSDKISQELQINSDLNQNGDTPKENIFSDVSTTNDNSVVKETTENDEQSLKEQNTPFSYIEPTWSGLPTSNIDYKFEVLKSGVIIETINLMKKSFWTFGRLQTCDIYMAHPTISRYHAVLQYKVDNTSDRPPGFYIYDLGSTHGTFLNKNKIKPKMYVRIQVGHMLKLGCSTRSYLLTGPEEDSESETELSITELKLKRTLELKQREEEELRKAQELEKLKKKEEERGIDWGLGEDADEETDLQENPYAETNNEELYLDDPKRTLRGFMEREGHELNYEVTERGVGQFLCSVVLPLDDARGRPIVAEALVKGKKKEAVVQCALEACRILDRHGILRQATHESRKRKAKNWEENDFYDSDEDTFLDRTGTIERKREWRMKSKQPQQAETYETLVAKEQKLAQEIHGIEKQLQDISHANDQKKNSEDQEDSLDHFMKELNKNKPDKFTLGKLKTELAKLKKDYVEVIKLVNIARPAHLPELIPQTNDVTQNAPSTSGNKNQTKALPMFGKRLKVKVMLPSREIPIKSTEEEEEEEASLENENQVSTSQITESDDNKQDKKIFEKIDSTDLNDEKQKKDEIIKMNSKERESSSKKSKIKNEDDDGNDEESERRRNKNIRRIMQRQEKTEAEKKKQYEEDAKKEDYNMWVPPEGQTGDGRTALNEKFGY